MRYLGGKSRISKPISEVINSAISRRKIKSIETNSFNPDHELGGYPLDYVVFYDTGMEFQAIYNNRDKIIPILKNKQIQFVELHPDESFKWAELIYRRLSE